MMYFPLLSVMALVCLLVGLTSGSPLLLSAWLSGLTGVMVYLLSTNDQASESVVLFIVEESLSLIIILSWWLWGGGLMIVSLLMLKSGLAPFHKWFIDVLECTSSSILIWSVTLHKTPVLALLSLISASLLINLCLMSLGVGVGLMLASGGMRSMFILSSNNTLILILIQLSLETKSGLALFAYYTAVLWSSWTVSHSALSSVFILLGLVGVPPLLLFQLKWSLFSLLSEHSLMVATSFVALSGLSTVAYARLVAILYCKKMKGGLVLFTSWLVLSLFFPA